MIATRHYRQTFSFLRKYEYDNILKGLLGLRESIKVFIVDVDSLNYLIEKIILDVPYLYFVEGVRYEIFKNYHYSILYPKYLYSCKKKKLIDMQIDIKIKQIADKIIKKKNGIELFMHTIICVKKLLIKNKERNRTLLQEFL